MGKEYESFNQWASPCRCIHYRVGVYEIPPPTSEAKVGDNSLHGSTPKKTVVSHSKPFPFCLIHQIIILQSIPYFSSIVCLPQWYKRGDDN